MKQSKVLIMIWLSVCLLLSTALAQKSDKPWTDWNKKEVQKMLEDSPWAQTQTETDNSEMMYQPTGAAGSRSNDASRQIQGATNQSINIKFFVRVFSARPIREALARGMMLQQNLPATALDRLRQFAEVKSEDSIILTVTYESNDQRYGN